jgi:hypothetical protein
MTLVASRDCLPHALGQCAYVRSEIQGCGPICHVLLQMAQRSGLMRFIADAQPSWDEVMLRLATGVLALYRMRQLLLVVRCQHCALQLRVFRQRLDVFLYECVAGLTRPHHGHFASVIACVLPEAD